jgi:hypothetical protein
VPTSCSKIHLKAGHDEGAVTSLLSTTLFGSAASSQTSSSAKDIFVTSNFFSQTPKQDVGLSITVTALCTALPVKATPAHPSSIEVKPLLAERCLAKVINLVLACGHFKYNALSCFKSLKTRHLLDCWDFHRFFHSVEKSLENFVLERGNSLLSKLGER